MPFTIPPEEIEFRASRAGGPGGQHVNTTSTRVEARWNVVESGALSERQRQRLLDTLASRIDTRGVLRVAAGERRSQLQNREAAVERLHALVQRALRVPKRRRKTKPSRAAVEKRLEQKRRRGQRKRERRPVSDDE
ncbi:MAG: alternative ribosome rescue aminoacyl-tRNA hydrolase ArfB [Gemmatimonadales bacterium]